MKKHLLFCLLLFISSSLFAQLEGEVVEDATGDPLIAATVRNTSNGAGAITMEDGSFSIEGEVGDSLQVNYVGFDSQTIIASSLFTTIRLGADDQVIDEVVIIGYGEAQSKDLTSAITTVQGEDIQQTPSGNPMQAMQGKVAGLQVVSAGAPGDSPTVRLRGYGSYASSGGQPANGTNEPLYVVDGMFFNNIDFIDNSDIKSVTVLKDASASAIYGVRAANGVVIIETRSGSFDQPTEISVDSYYGTQVATNVLKMANAEQYVQMASELNPATSPDYQFVLNAMQRYGRSRVNPNLPDVNTDWYDEIIRPAPMQNHNLNISGGSAKAAYSLGGSYFQQDGILDMPNEYERYNIRARIDFQAYDWLKVGANGIFSNAQQFEHEGSAWRTAYYAVPILPVNDFQTAGAFPDNYASAENIGYRGGQNPFLLMDYNNNLEKLKKNLVNVYGEIDLIPEKLKFRSQYNQNTTSLDLRRVDFPYFYSNGAQRNTSALERVWTNIDNKILDNTLTFDTTFDQHDLTLLAGHSYRNEQLTGLNARGQDIPINQENSWYLDNAAEIDELSVGDAGGKQIGISYFGRASYKFDNKYILYGTMRADGSSKYQEKWGYFPSVGAAWVVSEEDFFDVNGIDFLKLRGGWGQLGNDNVAASVGETTLAFNDTVFDNQIYSGYNPSIGFDSLVWELVEEINVGLTLDAFNNRLTTDVDYYIRDTENAAIPIPVPFVGSTVRKPVGVIRNEGLDLAMGWSDQINNDWSYNISGNFGTLKNEMLEIFDQPYIDHPGDFGGRTQVGQPVFSYFGLQTNGIYQNQAEIDNDPIAVENGLVPGDYRFVDANNDGLLNGDDRVFLGSFLPDITYGFNLGSSFHGLSVNASFLGQSGNQILNRKRGEYIYTNDTNLDADLANNLWRGEGTSNSYPSADGLRRGWNQQLSDYYIEEGDFFRIQNVNLAYKLDTKSWISDKFPAVTLKATAERPYTSFSYNGFNPEVANGYDNQTYPIPAVYTFGINAKF